MTLKEIIGEIDKAPIAVEKLRYDPLSHTEAVKLGIEYRKMLALENIGSLLAHIDATLTDLNETAKWK